MERKLFVSGFAVFFLALIIACSNNSAQKQKTVLEPFQLGIAHGGGFTGAVNGYRLDEKGNLVAFVQLPNAKENVTGRAVVPVDSVKHWYREITALSVKPADFQQKGDVYRKIFFQRADSVSVWLWSPADTRGVPQKLRNFYDRFLRFCQSHIQ